MNDNSNSPYESFELTFRYEHAYGELLPYFQGLRDGRAVAARCPVCARTWFPPRLSCRVDCIATEFVTLSGAGIVLALTQGPTKLPLTDTQAEMVWGLVRLHGAENSIVARIRPGATTPVPGAEVALVMPDADAPHPAQYAVFTMDQSKQ